MDSWRLSSRLRPTNIDQSAPSAALAERDDPAGGGCGCGRGYTIVGLRKRAVDGFSYRFLGFFFVAGALHPLPRNEIPARLGFAARHSLTFECTGGDKTSRPEHESGSHKRLTFARHQPRRYTDVLRNRIDGATDGSTGHTCTDINNFSIRAESCCFFRYQIQQTADSFADYLAKISSDVFQLPQLTSTM